MSEPPAPNRKQDNMRLCPTCRMEISTLATKCRYCGEEVGRPRDESRALSIADLGGETVQHYAPSSSVMEALEAFRSEEDAEPEVEEAASSGFFSKKSKQQESAKPPTEDGLPELDERSQALSSLAMPTAQSKYQPSVVKPERSIPRMVGIFAGLVATMLIGYFGVVQVLLSANKDGSSLGPTIENPGAIILQQGGDPLEALRGSLETEALENHESHRLVTREARLQVLANVINLLDANPWKSSNLDTASSAIGKAVAVDEHPDVKRKRDEVRAEQSAYNMFLEKTDMGSKRATFLYREAGKATKLQNTVGEKVLDRFEIIEVQSDRVKVKDHTRDMRPLTWHTNGEISSP